jgi:hypothetical protein
VRPECLPRISPLTEARPPVAGAMWWAAQGSSIPPAPWDGGAIDGELHPQQQFGDTYGTERIAGS